MPNEIMERYDVLANNEHVTLYYPDGHVSKPYAVECTRDCEDEPDEEEVRWHLNFATEAEARVEFERWRR